MELTAFLMQSPDLSETSLAAHFASHWRPGFVQKGAHLVHQNEPETREIIILDGYAVSRIYDPGGNAACVGLHAGPCVIAPNIARSRDGLSLVAVEAISDVLMMHMNGDALVDLMLGSEPIRNWANGILRTELGRKVDREWCLAALGGADRLAWFRKTYPGYEDIFVHATIASFLGMTPVTFSRLRAASGSA